MDERFEMDCPFCRSPAIKAIGDESARLDGPICPAARYANPGDLCVILCLFNVGSGCQKLENLGVCSSLLRESGIPLVIVESAFGDDPWAMGAGPGVLRVRTTAALWQKERLINLGLTLVPDRCTKVAWIDADILFENPDWAVTASDRLNDLAVVQLADRIVRLPRGVREYQGAGQIYESFGAVYLENPNALLMGDFGLHGHTGFAWASRRSILELVGLYDVCIAGGADHVMAHAFCGDWDSTCLTRMMGSATLWQTHAAAWASKIYPVVRAQVGVIEGAALHLWHGELESRRHMRRYSALWNYGFDPDRDIGLDDNGCWQWTSNKPALHDALGEYLANRRQEAAEGFESRNSRITAYSSGKGIDARL